MLPSGIHSKTIAVAGLGKVVIHSKEGKICSSERG
jgi:hypothetical protein